MSHDTAVRERNQRTSESRAAPRERLRANERVICTNCRMLLSIREMMLGKCGNCGQRVEAVSEKNLKTVLISGRTRVPEVRGETRP